MKHGTICQNWLLFVLWMRETTLAFVLVHCGFGMAAGFAVCLYSEMRLEINGLSIRSNALQPLTFNVLGSEPIFILPLGILSIGVLRFSSCVIGVELEFFIA